MVWNAREMQFYADLDRLATLARSAGPKRKPSTLREVNELKERMGRAFHDQTFTFAADGD